VKIEDEPTIEAMAARIKAGGYREVTTMRPHGPGEITGIVWSRPSKSIDLDWYKLTERFGDGWMRQLANELSKQTRGTHDT